MDVITAAINLVHDHPGGATALAPMLAKNPASLSHEVSPHCHHAKLGLADAVKLTVFSGNPAILNAFAAAAGYMVLPLPERATADPDALRAMSTLAREFSDVVGEVSKALADGRVSANELARVQREFGELVQAGQGVLAVLQRSHDDAAARALRAVA